MGAEVLAMKTLQVVTFFLLVQLNAAARDVASYSRGAQTVCNTNTTFACTSEVGKCIPLTWKCDGDLDCPKGEDEEGCGGACPKGEFRCGTSSDSAFKGINGCIPERWKCDGEFDCDDQSDEKDCKEIKCKQDQFKCSEFNGAFTLCIPSSWKCDGQNDCVSGEDEQNCEAKNCTANDFKCNNGICIFGSWKCDGEDDCGDGSDELPDVCDKNGRSTCEESTMFRCKEGNGCIPKDWLCDGESDCRDHSDEADCKSAKPATCHLDSEFACKTGKLCVSKIWKCDGEIDCPDGSDEADCENKQCGPGEKSCKGDPKGLFPTAHLCFPESLWCNGAEDCPFGDDEMGCAEENRTILCKANEYQCSGLPMQCVDKEKLCTATNYDCGDDTTCKNNITECPPNSANCKCHNSYVKNVQVCMCKPGFRWNEDQKQCQDVNECIEIPGVCDQICTNTIGSFRCGCHRGYKLSMAKQGSTATKCRAIGGDPLVLLSNRATIRQFDIVTHVHQPLVLSPGSAVAMDFHLNRSMIIWSDITQQKILMCQINNKTATENSFILDGTNCNDHKNQQVVYGGDVHTPDGLAIDWVHNLLFWTDGGLDQINVLNLDTKQKKVLFTDKLEEPRAIAVDPEFGLIFWTDWGQKAKIERAGMDGKNRTVIIEGDRVKWPNGLALDLLDKRVYWADAKVKSIFSCDYYGHDVKTVLHSHSYLRHPFSLAVFEDRVYFTDWEHDGVISVNKFTGGDVLKLMNHVSTPMTVRIYHKQAQPDHSNKCSLDDQSTNPCSAKRMCLPTGAIRGKDSSRETPYSGRPFSCICEGSLSGDLEETAECIAEALTGSTGFSLSTMLLFALVALVVVAGYAFYRNRVRGSSFTALNFDNPVYRRTVQPDMNDPFSDPFRDEGTVTVGGGPTQVEQPSRLVVHEDGNDDVLSARNLTT